MYEHGFAFSRVNLLVSFSAWAELVRRYLLEVTNTVNPSSVPGSTLKNCSNPNRNPTPTPRGAPAPQTPMTSQLEAVNWLKAILRVRPGPNPNPDPNPNPEPEPEPKSAPKPEPNPDPTCLRATDADS